MLGIGMGACTTLPPSDVTFCVASLMLFTWTDGSQAGFVPIAACSLVILPTPPIGRPALLEPLRLPTRELWVIPLRRGGVGRHQIVPNELTVHVSEEKVIEKTQV